MRARRSLGLILVAAGLTAACATAAARPDLSAMTTRSARVIATCDNGWVVEKTYSASSEAPRTLVTLQRARVIDGQMVEDPVVAWGTLDEERGVVEVAVALVTGVERFETARDLVARFPSPCALMDAAYGTAS